MKRILITGAAGFIGSHLAEHFLKKGFEVVGIDNFSGAHNKKYYVDSLHILNNYAFFTFHKVDVLNQKSLITILKKNTFDFVIHCAAKTNVRESVKNPQAYLLNNVLGTQILFEAIRQYNPQSKTIILSSSSVYGRQKRTPLREDMVPNPISPYGLSKYLMEEVVKYYSDNYHLKTVVLRPFSIYGPRGRKDMLPSVLVDCIENTKPFTQYGNNSNNQRDWTYIEDFVKVILSIIKDYTFPSYEVFNIGRSKSVGIETFIKEFCRITGKKLIVDRKDLLHVEMPIVLSDIAKAKKLLKFKPTIDYLYGLRRFLKKND